MAQRSLLVGINGGGTQNRTELTTDLLGSKLGYGSLGNSVSEDGGHLPSFLHQIRLGA